MHSRVPLGIRFDYEGSLEMLQHRPVKRLFERQPGFLLLDPHNVAGQVGQACHLEKDAVARLHQQHPLVDHAAGSGQVEHTDLVDAAVARAAMCCEILRHGPKWPPAVRFSKCRIVNVTDVLSSAMAG